MPVLKFWIFILKIEEKINKSLFVLQQMKG
jgi:hypothetical protein